jgi:hypothetical protein
MIYIGGPLHGLDSRECDCVDDTGIITLLIPNKSYGDKITGNQYDYLAEQYVEYNAAFGGDRTKKEKELARKKGRKIIPTALRLHKSLLPD